MSQNKIEQIDINDDEGFVSCQVCFTNFDEGEHVPKFLDKCHHFFCLTCIKSLVKGTNCRKKVTCPMCRATSVLSKKKCEDLGTNHVALHLLKVVGESQKKQNEGGESQKKQNKGTNQQWCSECNALASTNCELRKHEIINFNEVYESHSCLLRDIIKNSNSACDQALEIYGKIESSHEAILTRIRWLESEMSQKVLSNNANITHMESLKSVEGYIDALKEKDMNASMNKIKQLVVKFSDITEEVKAAELKAKDYFETHGRNDIAFLIELLKSQETDPSENATSVSNSSSTSSVAIQDNQTTKVKKVQELKQNQSQHLPKRRGEENAESTTLPTKKIRVQNPMSKQSKQKIFTKTALPGVEQRNADLKKSQNSNSTTYQSVPHSGTNDTVGNVQQNGGNQNNTHQQRNVQNPVCWKNIAIQLQKNPPFGVKEFQCVLSNLRIEKKEVDMSNLFKCNSCKKPIGNCYFNYCFNCEDYQLCVSCNGNAKHGHRLEKFGFDVIPQNEFGIELWVQSFLHAIECFDQQCISTGCGDIKRAFIHKETCLKPKGTNCSICNQLAAILIYHAKCCTSPNCRVPHCSTYSARDLFGNTAQQHTVGNNQTAGPVMQRGAMFSHYDNFYGTTSSYASTSGQEIPSYNYGMQHPMNYWYGNYQQYW